MNIKTYTSASILRLYVLIFKHCEPLDLSSSRDGFASHVSRQVSSMDIIRRSQLLLDLRKNTVEKITRKKLRYIQVRQGDTCQQDPSTVTAFVVPAVSSKGRCQ